jgi:hypothetical protein
MWLNGEEISVSRAISVLVLRVMKWMEFPSVSYIYLPDGWELHLLQYPEDVDGDDPRNVVFFAI